MVESTHYEHVWKSQMVHQPRQFLQRNLIVKEQRCQASTLNSLEADTESRWLSEDLLPVRETRRMIKSILG